MTAEPAAGPAPVPAARPAEPAPAPATAPAARTATPAPAGLTGDGKRVAVDPSLLVASGGDTPIARLLTRTSRAAASEPATVPVAVATVPVAVANGDVPAAVPVLTAASHDAGGDSAGGRREAAPAVVPPPPVPANAAARGSAALDAFIANLGDALALAPAPTLAPAAASGGPAPASDPAPVTGSSDPSFGALLALSAPADAPAIVPAPPPSTLPAPPPAADPNALVDQLVRGAFTRIGGTDGSSEIRLQLHPQQLGDLTVKLVVSGGDVSASVLASTPAAHDALVAGQAHLNRTLAEAGLKLTSFSVSHDGGANLAQQHDTSSQRRSPGERSRSFFGLAEDDLDADAAAIPSLDPPRFGGLGAGLNHLV